MSLRQHVIPSLLTAAVVIGGVYTLATSGIIPIPESQSEPEVTLTNVSCNDNGACVGEVRVDSLEPKVTWTNVSCGDHVCVANVTVDVPPHTSVVIATPLNITNSEDATGSLDYAVTDDATVEVMTGNDRRVDVYVYSYDGYPHPVTAYDIHEDGNVTEVEPEDPPLPSRTSAAESR